MMMHESDIAKKYFDNAAHDLELDDKPAMLTARAMQHIYFKLLQKIIDAKYNVYQKNIKVSKLENVGISLGVWAKYSFVY